VECWVSVFFPRPFGAKGIGGAGGPRVALRFTRGYSRRPLRGRGMNGWHAGDEVSGMCSGVIKIMHEPGWHPN